MAGRRNLNKALGRTRGHYEAVEDTVEVLLQFRDILRPVDMERLNRMLSFIHSIEALSRNVYVQDREENNNLEPLGVYTCSVTWSKEEAIELLTNAPMQQNKRAIFVEGRYLALARTDLSDNVCTSHEGMFEGSEAQVRERFINLVYFGARLTELGRAFAVIDRYSNS